MAELDRLGNFNYGKSMFNNVNNIFIIVFQ